MYATMFSPYSPFGISFGQVFVRFRHLSDILFDISNVSVSNDNFSPKKTTFTTFSLIRPSVPVPRLDKSNKNNNSNNNNNDNNKMPMITSFGDT